MRTLLLLIAVLGSLPAYSAFEEIIVVAPKWTLPPVAEASEATGIAYRLQVLGLDRCRVELRNDTGLPLAARLSLPAYGGSETVIEVELGPREGGTLLRLTHSGFSTEDACKAHEDNWPAALETLDEALSK